MGKLEAANEAEVQRKLLQQGFRPQAIAPAQSAMNATTTTAARPGAMGSRTGNTSGLPNVASSTSVGTSTGTRTGGIVMAGNAARVVAKQKPARPGAPGVLSHVLTPVPANASKLGGVSTRDLMFFFQQFGQLVKSGMTIYSALENLAPRTKNKNLSKVAFEMGAEARKGGRITDVMANYPRIFPDHIVGMVRAGELGGFLEIVLNEIAQTYETNIALYRGSWIPKMLATQSVLVLALTIPLMSSLFHSLDVAANMKLYLEREMVIFPIALGAMFLVKFLGRQLQLPQFRRLRDGLSLHLPAFGALQKQSAVAAFLRMLRKLYHAGVGPIQAWEAAMNTASNVVIREKFASAYQLMEQGAALPDAFSATGLFEDEVEQLVATGHHSGEIVQSLDNATTLYQTRIDEFSTKARFMMLRMGVMALLIFGGIATIWLTKSYFQGMFDFVDKMFPENSGQ